MRRTLTPYLLTLIVLARNVHLLRAAMRTLPYVQRLRQAYVDVAALEEGDTLSLDAMRNVYRVHLDAYCGEYSDGEYTYAEGVQYFRFACERILRKQGLPETPRNWARAATRVISASWVFAELA